MAMVLVLIFFMVSPGNSKVDVQVEVGAVPTPEVGRSFSTLLINQ